MSFVLRGVFPIAVTLVALGAALYRFDVGNLARTADALSLYAFVIVTLALLAGNLLACVRLQLIARDMNHRLRFLDVLVAMTSGQLAGSFFFQIFGQTLARSATLAKSGVSVSATIVITVYERMVAALVSLALAVFGALYLFGGVTFDIAGGGDQLIKIAAGLIVVAGAGAWLVWGRLTWPPLRDMMSWSNLLRYGRASAISIAIQATTMAAYVAAAHSLAPQVPFVSLVSATALVMLAASIPISLAGWGLREISAVYALGAIGMSYDTSLVVALLIGGTSIAVTALLALTGSLTAGRAAPPPPLAAPATSTSNFDPKSFLTWCFPLFAASAVFFQVYLPVGAGQLDVNLADSVVLFGGALFVMEMTSSGVQSRLPGLGVFLGLMSIVVVLSFLHGVWLFGWTSWAFTNRLFGWLVLISYAATGALLVQRAGTPGLRLLLRTFVVSGVAIAALGLAAITAAFSGAPIGSFLDYRLDGFAQNANAFAFQLLLVIAAIVALGDGWRARVAMGVAFATIYFSVSRVGEATLVVLCLAALLFRFLSVRALVASLAFACTVVAAIRLLPAPPGVLWYVADPHYGFSDSEHLVSIVAGVRMFLEHPVFGAGLGAFIRSHLTADGRHLIIHSTPLWLLAEMGIVGFLAFAVPCLLLLFRELRGFRHADMAGRLLLLSLIAFGAMSQFHELLYQRALWLLLGAALVKLPAKSTASAAVAKAETYGLSAPQRELA
jgi:hypothetical protein